MIRTEPTKSAFVFDADLDFESEGIWTERMEGGSAYIHPAAMEAAFGVSAQQLAWLYRRHELNPHRAVVDIT